MNHQHFGPGINSNGMCGQGPINRFDWPLAGGFNPQPNQKEFIDRAWAAAALCFPMVGSSAAHFTILLQIGNTYRTLVCDDVESFEDIEKVVAYVAYKLTPTKLQNPNGSWGCIKGIQPPLCVNILAVAVGQHSSTPENYKIAHPLQNVFLRSSAISVQFGAPLTYTQSAAMFTQRSESPI